MKTRIIGLGSPHGDDQAGWEVIRLLKELIPDGDVELLELDRPGPALISYLDGCDRAILIDACNAGWQPGQWQQLSLEELLQTAVLQGGSSHQLGLADSLQLALITGSELPELQIFAIQIAQTDLLKPISQTIEERCSGVAQELAHLINA